MVKPNILSPFQSKLRQLTAKQRQAIERCSQQVRQHNQRVRNLKATLNRYWRTALGRRDTAGMLLSIHSNVPR